MDFKVIWTDSAITDLKEICEYIGRDNHSAARRVGEGILDHVRILEAFPFIGPAYPRRSSGLVREIVFRKYRIFMKLPKNLKPCTFFVSGIARGARRICGKGTL